MKRIAELLFVFFILSAYAQADNYDLKISVKDMTSKEPVENALVQCVVNGDTTSLRTDAQGVAQTQITSVSPNQTFKALKPGLSVSPTMVARGGTVKVKISGKSVNPPTVHIYNTLGREVSANLKSLSKGMYFISVKLDGKNYTRKIIADGGFNMETVMKTAAETAPLAKISSEASAEIIIEKEGYQELTRKENINDETNNEFEYELQRDSVEVTIKPKSMIDLENKTLDSTGTIIIDRKEEIKIKGETTIKIERGKHDISLEIPGYFKEYLVIRDENEEYTPKNSNLEERWPITYYGDIDSTSIIEFEKERTLEMYLMPYQFAIDTVRTGQNKLDAFCICKRGMNFKWTEDYTVVIDTSEEKIGHGTIPHEEIVRILDFVQRRIREDSPGHANYNIIFTDSIENYYRKPGYHLIWWEDNQGSHNFRELDWETGEIKRGGTILETIASTGMKYGELYAPRYWNDDPSQVPAIGLSSVITEIKDGEIVANDFCREGFRIGELYNANTRFGPIPEIPEEYLKKGKK